MPIVRKLNKDGDLVQKYDPMIGYFCLTEDEQSKLILFKKEAAQDIELFNACKKRCESAKDIDGARYMRELISDRTKDLRACRLVLGYVGRDTLKDCPYVALDEWPVELSSQLDRVFNLVD